MTDTTRCAYAGCRREAAEDGRCEQHAAEWGDRERRWLAARLDGAWSDLATFVTSAELYAPDEDLIESLVDAKHLIRDARDRLSEFVGGSDG